MSVKSIRLTDGNNTILPESAESGSNANGNYVKFADGTLIQWGTVDSDEWVSAISFPLGFTNSNFSITGSWKATNGNRTFVSFAAASNYGAYVYADSNYGIHVYWLAIGRWK